MLEAQVAVLEDRLAKLQGPGEPVTLHNPHHRSAQHATSPSSTREARAATIISVSALVDSCLPHTDHRRRSGTPASDSARTVGP